MAGAAGRGLRYAVPVMTILLCHEMGHFLQAHRYGVYASLPFFIPMPVSPIGTIGAVIAMEPRVGHRRALFDIGITGPLAGLVPTLLFCIWGLALLDMVAHARSRTSWCIGTRMLVSISGRVAIRPAPARLSPSTWTRWPSPAGWAVDHLVEPDSHRSARRRARPLCPAAAEGAQGGHRCCCSPPCSW